MRGEVELLEAVADASTPAGSTVEVLHVRSQMPHDRVCPAIPMRSPLPVLQLSAGRWAKSPAMTGWRRVLIHSTVTDFARLRG